MPEIKNNFTGGKMNKDLDERIVPPGEYRHALNVQVSTSDGSKVGTIQSLLGNKRLGVNGVDADFILPINARCVGSISDESNNALYWFVYSINKDLILRYTKENGMELIFCDVNKDTLKFENLVNDNNLITGINIIDGMLFWTDSYSEPKKINIERCFDGTATNAQSQTRLLNPDQGITLASNIEIEEKHITVVKKSPKIPLTLELDTGRDPDLTYTGIMHITGRPQPGVTNTSSFIGDTLYVDNDYDFSGMQVGDIFYTMIDSDLNGNKDFTLQWEEGMMIVFKEFKETGSLPNIPITDYRIRGIIKPWYDGAVNLTSFEGDTSAANYDAVAVADNDWVTIAGNIPNDGTAHLKIEITSIDGNPPSAGSNIGLSELKYAVDRWDDQEKLFEFRFPRFSY